jgi:hypothetical protein
MLLAKSAGKFAAPGRRFPWETNACRTGDCALFRMGRQGGGRGPKLMGGRAMGSAGMGLV